MPTVKNERVEMILSGLGRLAQLRLPVAGALRVRKVTRALQEHWDDLQAVRGRLIEQYCKKDEKGKPIPTQNGAQVTYEFEDDAAREAFTTEWGELMAQEFSRPYGIEEGHLGKGDIEPSILISLDEFLVETDDGNQDVP